MEITPWIQVLFYFITAFAIFAVLNVITGVFVELSLTYANEDKKTSISTKIRDIFDNADSDHSGDISWSEFVSTYLRSDVMQEYLKELDIDESDAKELFNLLDVDGTGAVG